MNKSQFIDTLAAQFDGNKKAASEALDAVIDTIAREVARGEKVAITGFGAFEKALRPARMVRNPRTGERVRAKKTAVPKFRAGAELKAVVSGAKKLPKAAVAKVAVAKKSTSKTTASASTGRKSAAKKSTAKKSSPAKKTTARKTTARKSPAKKTTARKTTAKKSLPARKTAGTRSTATRSPARKTTAKKSSTRKSTAKKS